MAYPKTPAEIQAAERTRLAQREQTQAEKDSGTVRAAHDAVRPKGRQTDYVPTVAESVPLPDEDNAQIARLQSEQKDLAAQLVEKGDERQRANAEYEALVNQAALKNAELMRLVGTPSRKPTTLSEYSAQEQARGVPLVRCFIPKPFQHRLDDHQLIDVQSGARDVPQHLADHWWFRANGAVSAA